MFQVFHMDILGIVSFILTILSTAIAFWEHHRADDAEKQFTESIQKLPHQIDQIDQIAEQLLHRFTLQNRNFTPSQPNSNTRFSISHADIDGDGMDELLVQYPGGAHGSVLDVFGWKDMEFRHLGGLAVGTPEGFWAQDFDHDGRIEIGTKETDWSTDLPYYLAPRLLQWYRWTNNSFQKVREVKDYSSADLAEIKAKFLQEQQENPATV
ncbi:MAG: VCBS repeat-containing protein [Nitrospira sp.]|nr:VCBS repeat-containing protein [Nitrospira sp.]